MVVGCMEYRLDWSLQGGGAPRWREAKNVHRSAVPDIFVLHPIHMQAAQPKANIPPAQPSNGVLRPASKGQALAAQPGSGGGRRCKTTAWPAGVAHPDRHPPRRRFLSLFWLAWESLRRRTRPAGLAARRAESELARDGGWLVLGTLSWFRIVEISEACGGIDV